MSCQLLIMEHWRQHRGRMELYKNSAWSLFNASEYYELPDWYLLINERLKTSGRKDLFDFTSHKGFLKEDLAQNIFKQIGETVASCHTAGVIHRDIKDEKILVTERQHQVKLIDFGSGDKYHGEIYIDFDSKSNNLFKNC